MLYILNTKRLLINFSIKIQFDLLFNLLKSEEVIIINRYTEKMEDIEDMFKNDGADEDQGKRVIKKKVMRKNN